MRSTMTKHKHLTLSDRNNIQLGLEHGKLLAFLDMVRQHVLTSEFASQQLGMTVSEFEALL